MRSSCDSREGVWIASIEIRRAASVMDWAGASKSLIKLINKSGDIADRSIDEDEPSLFVLWTDNASGALMQISAEADSVEFIVGDPPDVVKANLTDLHSLIRDFASVKQSLLAKWKSEEEPSDGDGKPSAAKAKAVLETLTWRSTVRFRPGNVKGLKVKVLKDAIKVDLSRFRVVDATITSEMFQKKGISLEDAIATLKDLGAVVSGEKKSSEDSVEDEIAALKLTPGSKELMHAIVDDIPNWGDTSPTFNHLDSSLRGNLTQLKRKGLVKTSIHDSDTWIYLTDLGKRLFDR